MRVEITSKSFTGTKILGAISFEVENGEFVAIDGPSGIGKTTLLRIIAGLEVDYEGQIVDRPSVGMVFQEPRLLPWLTVAQNIGVVAELPAKHPAITRLLKEIGLGAHAHKYPAILSLGQARRAALARALVIEPGLLLLDEPFVSLDQETAETMQKLVTKLVNARNCAVVMVTHNHNEALRLSDRVISLGGNPAVICT